MNLRSTGEQRSGEIQERMTSRNTLYFTTGGDTVLSSYEDSQLNWWRDYTQNDGEDAWRHYLHYTEFFSSNEYFIWAADEGAWGTDEYLAAGKVCDEYVQSLVGTEKNNLRVLEANMRFYTAEDEAAPRDWKDSGCMMRFLAEDMRTGREYYVVIYVAAKNTELKAVANWFAKAEFGGLYDISDMDSIAAAEYLNSVLVPNE